MSDSRDEGAEPGADDLTRAESPSEVTAREATDTARNANEPSRDATVRTSDSAASNEVSPDALSPTVAARRALEAVRYEESPEPYLAAIADASDADLDRIRTDRRAGLAFWLNLYNAAAQLLLDRRPELFESRVRFFRADAVTVAGVELSLDDIEHGIIRDNRSKYGLGYLPRLERTGLDAAYRLEPDLRIHFALNCGAASCPSILSYEPETVDRTLDEATRSYLDQTVEYDPARNRVVLPQVCLWFVGDFGGRSGLRRLVREFDQVPPGPSPSLRFAGYDWTKAPRQFQF